MFVTRDLGASTRCAIALLCMSCFSREAVRPRWLAYEPLDVSEGHLELTKRDSKRYAIDAPLTASASGDMIHVHVEPRDDVPAHDFAFRNVDKVELVTWSAGRTFALVGGLTIGAATVAALIALFVVSAPRQPWSNVSFGFGH
jgi:hypothetical protein